MKKGESLRQIARTMDRIVAAAGTVTEGLKALPVPPGDEKPVSEIVGTLGRRRLRGLLIRRRIRRQRNPSQAPGWPPSPRAPARR